MTQFKSKGCSKARHWIVVEKHEEQEPETIAAWAVSLLSACPWVNLLFTFVHRKVRCRKMKGQINDKIELNMLLK